MQRLPSVSLAEHRPDRAHDQAQVRPQRPPRQVVQVDGQLGRQDLLAIEGLPAGAGQQLLLVAVGQGRGAGACA